MDFTLTDEQCAWRDRARAFAREVLAPTVDDKDQRQEFPLDELRAAAGVGLTEAESGSDAGAMQTTARRDGDGWVLDGRKQFITTAPYAGLFVVFAVTDPDERPADGVSAFLVEPGFPGFSLGPEALKMGLLSSKIAELRFDGCRVPAANLLGQEGRGFRLALELLDSGRIGIGAQAVGIGQAALDAALAYSQQREQFGKPIAEFQAIQWKLADMQTRLDAARLLVHRAAVLKDAGQPFGREAAMAKLFASETANFCADQALQVYGGYGYLKAHPVERYYRDAKACELYEGTSEIQRLVIARHLLRGQ